MEKQKELIKRYIKKEISLEVIALEFGVPIELVEQCRQELLSESRSVKTSSSRPLKPVDSTSSLKMNALRKKYKDLYENEDSESTKKQKSKNKELSQEQLQQIESIIDSIEQRIQKISTVSRPEVRKLAIRIVHDVRQLQEHRELPFDLATKFKRVIDTLNIRDILTQEYELYNAITNAKKMAGSRVIQAIARSVEEAKTIEELTTLYQNITTEMERTNQLEVSSVKSRIQKRISDLRLKEAKDKIKRVPPNIASIIESLAVGEIDIENASKIVEEEAKTRVASRPQNKFSVTEEQEKKQIGMQIRTAIMETPDKYQLSNPEAAIVQIQQLFGDSQAETIRAVVTNLIGRKRFETAKRICRKYSIGKQDATLATHIRRLEEEIKNAEISDMVLQGINMIGTPDELGLYYESIEMKLKTENVNLGKVSLGKSEDGKRDITLEDIWLPEAKNKKGINR